MPRGDKSKSTDAQARMAGHLARSRRGTAPARTPAKTPICTPVSTAAAPRERDAARPT